MAAPASKILFQRAPSRIPCSGFISSEQQQVRWAHQLQPFHCKLCTFAKRTRSLVFPTCESTPNKGLRLLQRGKETPKTFLILFNPKKTPPSSLHQMISYKNLRDEENFPTFKNCPTEAALNSNSFWDLTSKHWCLLAQITQVDYVGQLRLVAQDTSGTTFPIAFYPSRSTALRTRILIPGYTMAILYPCRHEFPDLSEGIRLDELTRAKVCPRPLPPPFAGLLTNSRSSPIPSPSCYN